MRKPRKTTAVGFGSILSTVPEGAAILGVSEDAVRGAFSRSELPGVRIGTAIRLVTTELLRLAGDEVPDIEWPVGVADLTDFAAFLRVCRASARQAIQNGDVPGYRIGRCYRAKWAAIRQFVESASPSPETMEVADHA